MTMRVPLYQFQNRSLSTGGSASNYCSNENPGLRFDKFAEWENNPQEPLKDKAKSALLKLFAEGNFQYLKDNLDNYLERREKLLNVIHGQEYRAKTSWRLVSGLGSSHPYETGLIWHRTLGVPYLSGSAIKGVIRSWLIEWEGKKDMATRLFGDDCDQKNPKPGNLIVFDAIPESVPKLEMDILNPHYQPYYENPENNPPADYYNPVPVFFLTVAAKQTYSFALAPRLSAYGVNDEEQIKKDLEEGKKALYDALENIGAGGKTAVGYGLFEPVTTGGGNEEVWEKANITVVGNNIEADNPNKKGQKASATFQSPKQALGITGKKLPKKYKPGGNGKHTVRVELFNNRYVLKEVLKND